jgi:hypothetical protein
MTTTKQNLAVGQRLTVGDLVGRRLPIYRRIQMPGCSDWCTLRYDLLGNAAVLASGSAEQTGPGEFLPYWRSLIARLDDGHTVSCSYAWHDGHLELHERGPVLGSGGLPDNFHTLVLALRPGKSRRHKTSDCSRGRYWQIEREADDTLAEAVLPWRPANPVPWPAWTEGVAGRD